jgi:Right handed beta helix region
MITAADIQEIRNNDPGAVLPGIDTMTGNPYATSSLLDVSKITQNSKAPIYYNPSTNTVYIFQAGAVISGINFGDATVLVNADNVTIKDCTFIGDAHSSFAIRQEFGAGTTVENCTFQGSKEPTEGADWIFSNANINIEDNNFLDTPGDAIDISGSATGGGLIAGNYFSGSGYATGAHADAIWVTKSTEPLTITDNFIDQTAHPNSVGVSNSSIRITAETGNVANVTVSGNYLIGGSEGIGVGPGSTTYTVNNVSVVNNYIGFYSYFPYYPGTDSYATMSGTTIVDFSNPADSTQALATYLADVPTTNAVPASGPTMVFGNGVAAAHLGASTGETNFVGGLGSQVLFGNQGVSILTYLAIGDGGDVMTAFDPAKDVIDLSNIDADITTPGVQNFTFIGDAPFTGGAQVRYQLSPANNTTIVQAALAGDASADFTLTLRGLVPLTAADFALTPSQSAADLTNGGMLSYKKLTTAAGAPAEYAYTNVQGKAYTSYESFIGSIYENLAADDLNLSSNTNELVLYDPTQTVTRGGGAETLLVAGMGSDPLTYHPVETIDATTSGGEQFIFSAGFGKETIQGFNASGASPDSIQLATSAFSYLTPGMTQAQDLAAVLSQATRGPSGLTISDTHGDSLTVAGLTPSMLAVNPAMLQFT